MYILNILVITKDGFVDHLKDLENVLQKLRESGLTVNIDNSFFRRTESEYLGF